MGVALQNLLDSHLSRDKNLPEFLRNFSKSAESTTYQAKSQCAQHFLRWSQRRRKNILYLIIYSSVDSKGIGIRDYFH